MGFDAAIALLVCVALAAGLGVLAQRILGLKVGGFVGTVFLGTVGAYLGKEAAHGFGLPEVAHLSIRGRSFPLLWSIIGALAATLIVAAYSSRGRKAKRK